MKRVILENDFKIVAVASLHNLDVVVSQDNETLCSSISLKSYSIVNRIRNMPVPEFINYEKFKRWFV